MHSPMTREDLHYQFRELAAQRRLDVDVISDGPINSDCAFIGEGLGVTEIEKGRTFVGGSGRMMFDTARRFGIDRSNVYVTNVVKRQISLSRKGNERHAVLADELQLWEELLRWELEQLPNLRTVFLLGNYAMSAILGHGGVMDWRGSVLDIVHEGRDLRCVVSINPAYAMREPKLEPVFQQDVGKLGAVVNGTWKPHVVEELINPTKREALDFIRMLEASDKPVSYDIETMNGETACHGIGNSSKLAMCINMRDAVHNRFSPQDEADIMLALQDLFDSHITDPKTGQTHGRLIAHNGSFDAYWTRLHDYLCAPVWFDTLLAHHTLYPSLPHKLAFLVAQYTTHPYYKNEGKTWREGGDVDQFWRYNCKDVALTYACHLKLKRELEEQGQSRFFFDHVMRAQPHLVSATVHGVKVDMGLKAKIAEAVSEDVAKLKAEFHRIVQELTGDPDYWPNPGSWQQLKRLFFDVLKLKGRGTSTDETNRTHILKNPATPPLAREMLTVLNKFKEQDKFRGTYAESRPSSDGRMRCEYKQYGVSRAPGRLSSAALLDGTGINMQNQPVRARAMYEADAGMVFGYFDLKGAEAQVVAVRADIHSWKEQFARALVDDSYDTHRALAADLYNMPYDQTPKSDVVDAQGRSDKDPNFDPSTATFTIRYKSKRARHGLNYRMEEYTLSEKTGLPFHESRELYRLYHRKTPELKPWWAEEEKQFRATKQIVNGLGRRWRVLGRIDDDVLESIIAYYPQSTIGDKVTRTWYMAEDDDEWPMDARVCIDVHDNLVCLASPKTIKTALKVLKRHAEEPMMLQDVYRRKTERLVIPAELKMSVPDENGVHRWSNLKEVKL